MIWRASTVAVVVGNGQAGQQRRGHSSGDSANGRSGNDPPLDQCPGSSREPAATVPTTLLAVTRLLGEPLPRHGLSPVVRARVLGTELVRERCAGLIRRERSTEPLSHLCVVVSLVVVIRRPVRARARHRTPECWLSAGGAGDERGDDVGGVPIQRLAATVIAHRCARVGVAGRFLHVTKRDTGVQGGGDEGVTQGVRSDSLADPGTAGDTVHDPPGSVPIEPVAVRSEEDRTFQTFPDGQVDCTGDAGGEGIVTSLPPLRNTVRLRWPRPARGLRCLRRSPRTRATRSTPATTPRRGPVATTDRR